MEKTEPCALVVNFRGEMLSGEGGFRAQYLFARTDAAMETLRNLHKAATDYHARANDRERFVEFEHTAGIASVDVSLIAALTVDDPLGRGRAAFEAWETGVQTVKGMGQGARRAARDAVE